MKSEAVISDSENSDDYTIWLTITSTYTLDSSLNDKKHETTKTKDVKTTVQKVTVADVTRSKDTFSSKSTAIYLFPIDSSSDSKIQDGTTSVTKDITRSSSKSSTSHSSSKSNSMAISTADASKNLNGSNTSTSLKVGLAIGLPLVIALLIAGGIYFWYYTKKKVFQKRRKETYPYRRDIFGIEDSEKGAADKVQAQELVLDPEESYMHAHPGYSLKNAPHIQARTVRNFINRMSRSLSVKNVENEENEPTKKRISTLMSPMFLRKFHLTSAMNDPNPSNMVREIGRHDDRRNDDTNDPNLRQQNSGNKLNIKKPPARFTSAMRESDGY